MRHRDHGAKTGYTYQRHFFSTSAEYTAGCLGAAGHQRGWYRSEGSPPLHMTSHVRALSGKAKRTRESVTGGAPGAAPSPARPQAEQADGGDRGDHDEDQPNRTEDTARQNKTEANEAEQEPGRAPRKRLKGTGRRDQGAALKESINDEGGAHTTQTLPGSD